MMMKIETALRLVAAYVLAAGPVLAAEVQPQPAPVPVSPAAPVPVQPTNAPKIQFALTTYDFGKVKQGEIVKHDYIFTNTGVATLEILQVKPGCGCTTAGEWDKKVEPGQTGRIPLQFNSSGFGGTVGKSAAVICSDPAQPQITLILSGTVWKPIDINPTILMFQADSEDQTNQTKVVRLVSNVEEPVTLSDITSSNPQFKAEVKEIKPGKEFELLVTAVPPFTGPSAGANLSLKTSSAQASNLNVSAFLTVQQLVTVTPQLLMIPPGPLASTYTSQVTIVFRGTNSFRLTDPQISLPGPEVAVRELQTGHVFTLQVTFPVGFRANSAKRPELTVKTDHPKFPELKVVIFEAQPVPGFSAAPPVVVSPPQNVTTSKRIVPTRSAPPHPQ
ncbi:MAG: DUF1573 domain-containing protein [Verrucomicrobia bacterium]|nr:DUF1573 domain-containing protein [Verrucomicrobiota bacterium]